MECLIDSQRAMVAATLANMPLGGASYRSANLQTDDQAKVSHPQAAAMLDVSQRAMVAAKLATMRQGARTDLASIEAMSQDQAADHSGSMLFYSRIKTSHAGTSPPPNANGGSLCRHLARCR